jgi:hypothetical protein
VKARNLLFIILIGLTGCPVQTGTMRSGPVEPVPPGRPRGAILSGMIRNRATGQPLWGVSVDVTSPALGNRSLTVQTGKDGLYTTEPIPPGDFKIRVRREGFQVIDREMHVGNVNARLDIDLDPK